MDTAASDCTAMSRRVVGPAEGSSTPPVGEAGWLPPREPAARTALVRGVAVVTLAFTGLYLTWRAAATINLDWWWVAVPLLLVEIHNAFGLLLYTLALWDVNVMVPAGAKPPAGMRVAVLIPTYNEPPEVLLPTIAASVALKPEHETWVLDDGRRESVRELAEKLGARYLTRPDNQHAKAGNLNHALGVIRADIIAVLDADHVPTARFLTATLPYFADPKLAFVQTPQDFYNLESFEHQRRGNGEVFNEEAVFYRVIAPAKNRWSAPFWCGTCALVRVEALRSVGGVATDSVTEDIHTTIRMYRAGWRGAYHNEVLARGLAPDDASQYLLQRNRWATGAMQVLRRENPLFGPGLTAGQRLAFMTTLSGWFDSWRTLAYMLIPLAVVGTGAVPIDAPGIIFAPFFVATLVLQMASQRLLSRGRYSPFLSILFDVIRMPAVLPATLALLAPGRRSTFRVTPKGRTATATVGAEATGGRARTPVPGLLSLLAIASFAGLAWFVLNSLGLGPISYEVPWAAVGAAAFAALNLGLLLAAIARIRSTRFAGNRRAAVRLPVSLPATADGKPCEVLDLSVTGARVVVQGDVPGSATLTLGLGDHVAVLASTVRRRIERGAGLIELGLEFYPGQETEIAKLAVGLFHTGIQPALEGLPERRRGLVWRQAAA
jgi:cellulose synthase (UDP-forming)